jgi:hypothetical protein
MHYTINKGEMKRQEGRNCGNPHGLLAFSNGWDKIVQYVLMVIG